MNQLIVTITHSNYLLRSSGTEKFVRTVSKLIMNNDDHHLNFFSIKSDKSIGVNYDDKFVGIFRYKDISKLISYYGSLNNSMINSIQIHHLLYWDIEIVKNLLLELQIPIYIFVHDC